MAQIVGSRFRFLTVVRSLPGKPGYFWCRCDCGTEKPIRGAHMIAGKIISCGCAKAQAASERAHLLHKANTTHGLTDSRAYEAWHNMRARCGNPNATGYERYGGRGITICLEWQRSFEAFLSDMGHPGEGETLERIDNNGNYEPTNCRWASRKDQANNRAVNQQILYRGQTMNVSQWAQQTGIPRTTIELRLGANLPLDQVFSPTKRVNLSGLRLGGKANGERLKAKTHCKRGHPFDSENSYFNGKQRVCRACHKERQRH